MSRRSKIDGLHIRRNGSDVLRLSRKLWSIAGAMRSLCIPHRRYALTFESILKRLDKILCAIEEAKEEAEVHRDPLAEEALTALEEEFEELSEIRFLARQAQKDGNVPLALEYLSEFAIAVGKGWTGCDGLEQVAVHICRAHQAICRTPKPEVGQGDSGVPWLLHERCGILVGGCWYDLTERQARMLGLLSVANGDWVSDRTIRKQGLGARSVLKSMTPKVAAVIQTCSRRGYRVRALLPTYLVLRGYRGA